MIQQSPSNYHASLLCPNTDIKGKNNKTASLYFLAGNLQSGSMPTVHVVEDFYN